MAWKRLRLRRRAVQRRQRERMGRGEGFEQIECTNYSRHFFLFNSSAILWFDLASLSSLIEARTEMILFQLESELAE